MQNCKIVRYFISDSKGRTYIEDDLDLRARYKGWRKMKNEGIHNLYSSLNIIKVIKS